MNPEMASTIDTACMTAALELAESALAADEFPVGCVIADGPTLIAKGHRLGTTDGSGNEIDHAEINALRNLCTTRADVDRSLLTVYCTMEPCLMCYAAILLSGIPKIVYAYEDVMGGGTRLDRSALPPLYRDARLTLVHGVLRTESLALFRRYFTDRRHAYWSDSPLSRYTLAQPLDP